MKRAMFVGRWQPFHDGHKWLIDQKLGTGKPVLICVRDIPPDENNPFTTEQTIEMIRRVYINDNVEVIKIPDIESINYGRGVGYEVTEHKPPADVAKISATEIRTKVYSNDDSWKDAVDSKIHSLILDYLNPVESNEKYMGAGI